MRNKLILLFSFVVSIAIGQTDPTNDYKSLTAEQNLEWLSDLKRSDKNVQPEKLGDRFSDPQITSSEGENTPLVILEGIPLSFKDIKKSKRDFLLSHLTTDHIQDLMVLEKEPEKLYIDKKFTGIILLTFKDKRTGKKWKILN